MQAKRNQKPEKKDFDRLMTDAREKLGNEDKTNKKEKKKEIGAR